MKAKKQERFKKKKKARGLFKVMWPCQGHSGKEQKKDNQLKKTRLGES